MFLSRKWEALPRTRCALSCFNGAGMFLSRKYCTGGVTAHGVRASMGPGCFYPGNSPSMPSAASASMLQWGRDVSIPEMRRAGGRSALGQRASMGPGCFYPGNTENKFDPYLDLRLQWGRDVSIPEICRANPQGRKPARFNGAGMFLSRKCRLKDDVLRTRQASMGPGCFYPGNQSGRENRKSASTLQWGRDVSIPEISQGLASTARSPPLQWGRDVSIPEIAPAGYSLNPRK